MDGLQNIVGQQYAYVGNVLACGCQPTPARWQKN